MPDGERPRPGGWNRIHLIVDDLRSEVARLRAAGVRFRNDTVTGPGGSQILLMDPSGNLVELFEPPASGSGQMAMRRCRAGHRYRYWRSRFAPMRLEDEAAVTRREVGMQFAAQVGAGLAGAPFFVRRASVSALVA